MSRVSNLYLSPKLCESQAMIHILISWSYPSVETLNEMIFRYPAPDYVGIITETETVSILIYP